MRLRLTMSLPVLLTLLLSGDMLCLLPGVQLSLTERECCRRMKGECDRTPMPEHSCCKTVPQQDVAIALKATSLSSRNVATIDFPIEVAVMPSFVIASSHDVSISDSPPGRSIASTTILRI